MKLTSKQQRFVDEYLIDLNATQAAIRAGYSRHTANEIGAQNLAKLSIQAAIASAMEARKQRTELEADQVVRGLMLVAFGDLRALYRPDGTLKPVAEMTAEEAAQLAGVEGEELYAGTGKDRKLIGFTRKIRRWDKLKALELLGKHVGLFTERHEHSGGAGGPIKYEGVTATAADIADARAILGIAVGSVEHKLDPDAFRAFMDGVLATGQGPAGVPITE